MPNYESHQPGEFSWVELCTTDTGAARTFYGPLFGWQVIDMPMPEGQNYSMVNVDGRNAGAMYAMNAEQIGRGVKPHWGLYVAVANADETAAKARAAGGEVLMGPFDVMEFGRMAILRDPGGAVISVWQARSHIGTQIAGELNTFCWGELATKDSAQAAGFYTSVFDWGRKVGQTGPVEYTEWQVGSQSVGGMLQMTAEWGDAPPHWMPYFRVVDCDTAAARTKELGGAVCVPPTDIPPVGRFAVLTDPQGATFSIIKLN